MTTNQTERIDADQPSPTNEAIDTLDHFIRYHRVEPDGPSHARDALDAVRQALAERDTTIANQALAYANLDAAVDALEATVKDRDAEIARLRAALKPFASVMDDPEFQGDEEYTPPDDMRIDPLLRLGWFRRASAALEGKSS